MLVFGELVSSVSLLLSTQKSLINIFILSKHTYIPYPSFSTLVVLVRLSLKFYLINLKDSSTMFWGRLCFKVDYVSWNYGILDLPEGLPWMIFSDLKAHLQMTNLSASSSSDLLLRPFCRWNKAPAKATEKAAELPKPAPIGMSEETTISMGTNSRSESLKKATHRYNKATRPSLWDKCSSGQVSQTIRARLSHKSLSISVSVFRL